MASTGVRTRVGDSRTAHSISNFRLRVSRLVYSYFAQIAHIFVGIRRPSGLPLSQPASQEQQRPSPVASASYLLLCMKDGRYTTVVDPIDISNVKSDEELFTTLRHNYLTKREGFFEFLSLKTLSGIQFIKVNIIHSIPAEVSNISSLHSVRILWSIASRKTKCPQKRQSITAIHQGHQKPSRH
jgi:hypothetical protein